MNRRPFACDECGGALTLECPCCHGEVRCERCGESGLDPSKVNIEAFDMAVSKVRNGWPVWSLYEDGQHVGVCGGPDFKTAVWKLWYRDFPAGGGA